MMSSAEGEAAPTLLNSPRGSLLNPGKFSPAHSLFSGLSSTAAVC